MADNKYAMILAAGRGERLRPLTDNTPKPLLKAGSRLLIEHHLHSLSKAGFNNVVINIGHLGQQIIDRIGDGSQYKLSIQYSDERNGVLETGGGIFKALPLLKSENFLVINGDVWTDLDLSLLPEKIDCLAHLVLVRNPVHHLQGDFTLQGNLLQDKNDVDSSWTYSGIGVFSHSLFQNCEKERFALAPLLREHLAEGQITGEVYNGLWFDIGTIERLDALNIFLEMS
ncbi:D-glycero-alpha-D-manno-heptose 1-phosphate guanylyltransferase [bacterium BMS3Abin11]|nr:D-glycero-alpha-D-manno-heptose 1-phosphate guanylyltransferase [bacterium BMS3Abin11]